MCKQLCATLLALQTCVEMAAGQAGARQPPACKKIYVAQSVRFAPVQNLGLRARALHKVTVNYKCNTRKRMAEASQDPATRQRWVQSHLPLGNPSPEQRHQRIPRGEEGRMSSPTRREGYWFAP